MSVVVVRGCRGGVVGRGGGPATREHGGFLRVGWGRRGRGLAAGSEERHCCGFGGFFLSWLRKDKNIFLGLGFSVCVI